MVQRQNIYGVSVPTRKSTGGLKILSNFLSFEDGTNDLRQPRLKFTQPSIGARAWWCVCAPATWPTDHLTANAKQAGGVV